MPKKKHAKHMTTEEAVKHLFHKDVVQHAKQAIEDHDSKKSKPPKSAK
ncbi:MAG: hypothetical protein M3O09_19190 [Acidobacteriota bacterium]|nr:hypothetical protein [Acidobacteriota bacterium]